MLSYKTIAILALCGSQLGVWGARVKQHVHSLGDESQGSTEQPSADDKVVGDGGVFAETALEEAGERSGMDLSQALAPFHLEVDVLNKEEVIAAYVDNWWGISSAANALVTDEAFSEKISQKLIEMLPSKLAEQGIDLNIQKVSTDGPPTHFSLQVQVEGYDMASLGKLGLKLSEEDAVTFSSAFQNIALCLERMGMQDKADGILEGVGNKVRNALMSKLTELLPAQLLNEGVKVDMSVPEFDPAPTDVPSENITASQLGIDRPFLMNIVIEDRKALLDDAGVRGLKRFAGRIISNERFNELVSKKLEEKIVPALKEKAGIESTVKRLEGKHTQKDGIQVQMTIDGFDLASLLTMAKGKQFGEAFTELWADLHTLASIGVSNIQTKIDDISNKIAGTVRDNIQTKLKEILADKLHAKVETLDM